MLPLTLLAAQKAANLLTANNALSQQIAAAAQAANVALSNVQSGQVVLTASSPDIGDRDVELTYPRVCLYSTGLKNNQGEKFRTLSGTVTVVAEVWASAALVGQTDQSIHFSVDAVTNILQQNLGDWGDGVFFPGIYDVQFQAPKAGGFGFVESAKITVGLLVSRN
ncbi:MAG TPA: hypothetical protein VH351_17900 [Bryobacteraceae bacterium]|jgi:hypothetical protein|nr:hypothetical protein [Bryobacteraceae bacterium]